IADAVALTEERLAAEVLVDTGHDPQQRRLAGAVVTEHADLGAVVEGEPDPLEDLLTLRRGLAQVFHGVDELGHWGNLGRWEPAEAGPGIVAEKGPGTRDQG